MAGGRRHQVARWRSVDRDWVLDFAVRTLRGYEPVPIDELGRLKTIAVRYRHQRWQAAYIEVRPNRLIPAVGGDWQRAKEEALVRLAAILYARFSLNTLRSITNRVAVLERRPVLPAEWVYVSDDEWRRATAVARDRWGPAASTLVTSILRNPRIRVELSSQGQRWRAWLVLSRDSEITPLLTSDGFVRPQDAIRDLVLKIHRDVTRKRSQLLEHIEVTRHRPPAYLRARRPQQPTPPPARSVFYPVVPTAWEMGKRR